MWSGCQCCVFLDGKFKNRCTLRDKILQDANKKLLELKSKCKSLKVRDLKTAADLEAVGLKKQKTCM